MRPLTVELPSTMQFDTHLQDLSIIYSGETKNNSRSLIYLLRARRQWTTEMLTDWENTLQKLVYKLKAPIWRPVGRQIYVKERQKWLQLLKKTKLHHILAHVAPFVRSYWLLWKISEVSFESFQQICLSNRQLHAKNICTGVKIIENI